MVALGMLSTALKDLAVEMDLFVESGTQTNAKANDDNGDKNETVIRGSRAIIDKCDIACVITRVSENDLELLKQVTSEIGIEPTHVTDVYKVRRGKYTEVKIWSVVDLGTCRKKDLFITTKDFKSIDDFKTVDFIFSEDNADSVMSFIRELNSHVKDEVSEETTENPIQIDIDKIETKKGMFDGLM